MGRGGKKKPSKNEESEPPSVASLSISEAPASTSSATTDPPPDPKPVEKPQAPEPDDDGLGLGPSKKRKPRKKKAAGDAGAEVSASVSKSDTSQKQEYPSLSKEAPGQPIPPGQPDPPVGDPMQPGQPGPPVGYPMQPGQPGPPVGYSMQPGQPGPPPGYAIHQGQAPVQPMYPGKSGQGDHVGQPMHPGQLGPPRQGSAAQQGQSRQGPAAQQGQPRQGSAGQPRQGSAGQPRQGSATQQLQPPQAPTGQPRQATVQSQSMQLYKIPAKIPGRTVQCRPFKVVTNYLPMNIKPLKVHRYDVAFKPERPKKVLPQVFDMVKKKVFPKVITAFDQVKNCYTLQPLPQIQLGKHSTDVEIQDSNNKTMKFEVIIQHTGVVDLGTIMSYMNSGTSLNPPTEAIQCVDVILRQGTLESYVKAGRQYFKRPNNPTDLGDGLEIWTGLFQSAIFTSRSFINIDVAHKGFPKNQPLLTTMTNDFRIDPSKPVEAQRGFGIEGFKAFLKGLRVVASIGGDLSKSGQKREFLCNDLAEPANKLMFTMTDQATGKSKKMSVADYFIHEKKCRLQYPNFNCVWVGPRDKKICYPIELLYVGYGQARNKQLNDRQLSTMVRVAATPPNERKAKIEECIRDMKYPSNPTFKHFGLDISNEFFNCDAKLLRPPSLDVGGQSIEPRRGVWQANSLKRPEALRRWGFIGLELNPNACEFEKIKNLMMGEGRRMGMMVEEPILKEFNVRINQLQAVLFTALEKEVKFLFIIIPRMGRDHYQRIKRSAELDVGILTQCIKEETATRRMNPQTAKNILLKVNSKLMGINQVLDERSTPRCLMQGGVMVVGADVTHPSPDQVSIPSIAAVTASIDPKCFIYNIELSIQSPKKEMIHQFEDMMVDHLKLYYSRQKALPRKIFIFRDGVSEGQFAEVMKSELRAAQNAYKRLTGKPDNPEILFLLVQKRHHTRFFSGPTNPQNVEPGTCVDTAIVHARELDFYLVSHQAIKGTARPTRYHAVCNDGKIPDDEVEQLTYYLCHLYSRCMRAVSYPTPTYYAHLACLRARALTYGDKFNNDDLDRNPKRLKVLDKMLQHSRMFFV